MNGEPACDLVFIELAALQGPPDGVTSRRPLLPVPGGGYISGTYRDGTLARWSEDGALVETLGQGPGQGPGEFEILSDLALDDAGVLNVLTGSPLWHRYSLDGRFLETISDAPRSASKALALASGGLVVTQLAYAGDPMLAVYEAGGQGVRHIGPLARTGAPLISVDRSFAPGLFYIRDEGPLGFLRVLEPRLIQRGSGTK